MLNCSVIRRDAFASSDLVRDSSEVQDDKSSDEEAQQLQETIGEWFQCQVVGFSIKLLKRRLHSCDERLELLTYDSACVMWQRLVVCRASH